jgi:hypothetical protein
MAVPDEHASRDPWPVTQLPDIYALLPPVAALGCLSPAAPALAADHLHVLLLLTVYIFVVPEWDVFRGRQHELLRAVT